MIEINHLTYTHRGVAVVNDLTLKIRNGRICGIFGEDPDALRAIARLAAGCLRPTKGQVLINGYDVHRQPIAAKRQMAYLPEPLPTPYDMTPFEYLSFIAEVRGVDGEAVPRKVHEALIATNLVGVQDRLGNTLSPTAIRRLSLAATLIDDLDTIILNDPLADLNSKQRAELLGLLRRLYAAKTVLLTGTPTPELKGLCDQIALLADGRCTEVSENTTETLAPKEENA